MTGSVLTIGGASGYWGDAPGATAQLLAHESLDFLVYDYLAEITLSILARARAADPQAGYATDFVTSAMAPNLQHIAQKGVRVISNAGGVNPDACAQALRDLLREQGLALRVAVVKGDDLAMRTAEFAGHAGQAPVREMFTGEGFPPPERVSSVNAYLGASGIAAALDRGADIVITGRCVDSAVTLGACLHYFRWSLDDLDRLAQGSLAGHLLECGTQATGGNFTDWEAVAEGLWAAGYPLAEIAADGDFVVTRPADTGGRVTVGTVAEQMLYEIGDPRRYILPDVICDFSEVQFAEVGEDRVRVSGARGAGRPETLKVCATWADGFRAGHLWTLVGRNAEGKARAFARGVLKRTEQALVAAGLPPLSETSIELPGGESQFPPLSRQSARREVNVKIAVKHPTAEGVAVFLKEMTGHALAAPPGLCSFAGARARPSPVVRLFSFTVPAAGVPSVVAMDDGEHELVPSPAVSPPALPPAPQLPLPAAADESGVRVSLEALAWARSGDKGDKANIGVIARKPEFLPYIAAALTEAAVAECFAHFLAPGQARPVERFYLPGTSSLNFLLHNVLGGGGIASLRLDAQGKAYAQVLLALAVPVPASLASRYGLTVTHREDASQ
ncbi:acyclic terpene utilization AtuA family protein [Chromatocurvus halotolerans]|uniref:Uncharacterized protein DUF1446 n=1 Tax=Chromatocurvus halotolerans TaxID=1132028 RepID=A0A4R2KVS4_9GAMM|nr:acyclic terpene utilization AtuA family protein [Chromatocurvus halotolerans]TCO77062.1 uncharacterized protein DUF1446 [Chromatocurvus halotolerans]